MTDQICSNHQISKIATELNAGHREPAMHDLNICTMDLLNSSDYSKNLRANLGQILKGDDTALQNANTSFNALAQEERNLWQAAQKAAHNKNPDGLCQLSIVEDKQAGPHAEITRAKCR